MSGDARHPAVGAHGANAAAAAARPPEPEFTVIGADPVRFAAAPGVIFRLRGGDAACADVFTVALAAQVQIEPGMRAYDPATRERLVELFGDPGRWSASTKPIAWAKLSALVPSFRGEVEFELHAPLAVDHDLGVAKYFGALRDGTIPLTFHFSGTVLYRVPDQRVQAVQVPWAQCTYHLPVATWRAAVDEHYGDRTWVAVRHETLEQLKRYKTGLGLLSLDDGIARLLAEAGERVAGDEERGA